VTVSAAHILVSSSQWKGRSFVVIEQGRLPLRRIMTIRTASNAGYCELLSVNVLVTLLTLVRGRLEINVRDRGLEIRRLMTVDAGGRAVSTEQSELRRGMVKPGELLP